MSQGDELAARLTRERFRRRRAAFSADLGRLLGRASPEPLVDAGRAVALAKEFRGAYESAAPNDWACARREWGADEEVALVDALHRVSRNLGARPAWLVALGNEPQVAPLASDTALDNPLGFAAASDYELALLDRDVAAGLWLVRHSHHRGDDVTFTWELEVFGEP